MNIEFVKKNFLFILFFFPLTYIIGIAITEVFILFFLIYFFLNKGWSYYSNQKIVLLLFFFSIYIGINALIQIPSNLKYSSIFHFRYVFFSLAVCLFFTKYFEKKFNRSFLSFFILILVGFLIFDSFFQFFLGENIFGQKILRYRVSSFFGDDLILGSFLIRLLPILLFYFYYLNINFKEDIFFYIIFFSLYFITIYLSGERTSLALLFGQILLFLIFVTDLRKIFLLSLMILFIFMISNVIFKFGKIDVTDRIFIKTYKQITAQNYNEKRNLKKNTNKFESIIKNLKIFSVDHQGHLILAKELFNTNPIFGVGPKGFRQFCRHNKYDSKVGMCSTHPHNFFAQILSELGIIGFLFYIVFALFLIKKILSTNRKKNINKENKMFLVISIGILVHLFPFLPSGNFLNNWISSFIYFKIGLMLFSLKKIH